MQLHAIILQDIVSLGDCKHCEGQLVFVVREVPEICHSVISGKLVQGCPGDLRHISAFEEAESLKGAVGLEDCCLVHIGCLLVL